MANSKEVFAGLSLLCLFAILFVPSGSKSWVYFLILAIVFGIGWFIKRK